MPLTLRVLTGPAAGTTHTLTRPGTVLIGRSSRCGLMLPSGPTGDLTVSHRHALVEYNPPACRVHDMKARNGTKVNDRPTALGELAGGDTLTVGMTRILVELTAPEAVTVTYQPPPGGAGTFDAETTRPGLPPRPARHGAARWCAACRRERPAAGAAMCLGCESAAAAHPQPIPGYRVVKELGRGAMGVVYLAVRAADHKRVAVKTILTRDVATPRQLAAFFREMTILRQLRHPHIVRYRDGGMTDIGPFLATDYVHGLDLKKVLARAGPFTVGNAVRAVRNALRGLAYAHNRVHDGEKGFVHRDLKPANLILEVRSQRQSVKIADFGLARAYHASQLSGLTLPGDVGGTPGYLPPEQILDFRRSEPSADIYAMGATLYALLTGVPPYDPSPSVAAALAKILDEDPVPVLARRPDLPKPLAAVIHTALARDPARRFPSADFFRAALAPHAEG